MVGTGLIEMHDTTIVKLPKKAEAKRQYRRPPLKREVRQDAHLIAKRQVERQASP